MSTGAFHERKWSKLNRSMVIDPSRIPWLELKSKLKFVAVFEYRSNPLPPPTVEDLRAKSASGQG